MSTNDDEKAIPALPAGALQDMAAAIEARERGAASAAPVPVVNASEAVCPNCFYVHEFRPKMFICRRFPPVPLFMGWQPSAIEGASPVPMIDAVYPRMAITSTCGEFKHRDPKKAA